MLFRPSQESWRGACPRHTAWSSYFSQTCKKCNTTASSEQHWACKPWSCMGARLQQGHRAEPKISLVRLALIPGEKHMFGAVRGVCVWDKTESTVGSELSVFIPCVSLPVTPSQRSWMTKHQHLGTAHWDACLWVSANYQIGTTVSVWCFIISLQMDILKR